MKYASPDLRVSLETTDNPDSKAGAEEALSRALDGKSGAVHALVAGLLPSVHAEVAATVLRYQTGDRHRIRMEVEDLIQDVWETLFRDDWRILRQFRPERGGRLRNFVRTVSRRVVIDALRSGRRNPWRERLTPLGRVESAGLLSISLEQRIQDRNLLARVYAELEGELGEKGGSALESLFARGLSIDEAQEQTGMTKQALYAWTKRIKKRAHAIVAEFADEAA